jgi:regulator of protease activity HflC (stomatin/prohibitin superfamily)
MPYFNWFIAKLSCTVNRTSVGGALDIRQAAERADRAAVDRADQAERSTAAGGEEHAHVISG